MLIAHIILPLALDAYTYGIPMDLTDKIVAGMRVGVSVRRDVVVGIVLRVQKINSAESGNLSPIIFLLDETKPLVNTKQLQIWEWIASYYMCPIGMVMRYALPSSLIPKVKTWVYLQHKISQLELSLEAYTLQVFLQSNPKILYTDLLKKFPNKTYNSAFEELLSRQSIKIHKEIQSSYKPIFETALSLHSNYQDLENSEILSSYQSKGNLHAVLQGFLKIYAKENHNPILLRELRERLGQNIRPYVNKLIKDGVFVTMQVPRLRNMKKSGTSMTSELSIENHIAKKYPQLVSTIPHSISNLIQPLVIHSNYQSIDFPKIYSHAIKELLTQGKQILFIYDEDQPPSKSEKEQLSEYYGEEIIFIDKYNNTHERHELWEHIGSGLPMLIYTDAKGLHLPIMNLGAIFLAGEPSHTRRRINPPYLNARDLALITAKIWQVPILLLSSMPSSDSIYQIELKNFNKTTISNPLPQKKVNIEHISLLQQPYDSINSTWLSEPVFQAIRQAKMSGNSIFLFQNRIGYAPYIMCKTCNWIAKCQHCNSGLTYFKKKNELRCRYCAKHYQVYRHCPICLSDNLEERKFGTEKVEIGLEKLFPGYNILRFDKDTLKHKNEYQNTLDKLNSDTNVDIFVGTVALLPFLRTHSIAVAAILDTDALLQPFDFNFRYLEQGFRLILQIKQLLLNSKHPQPRLLLQEIKELPLAHKNFLEQGDFLSFIQNELKLRQQFILPPICKMLRIEFKHKQAEVSLKIATSYAEELNKCFSEIEIIGPGVPMVNKIRDEFIHLLHLKIPRNKFWNYEAKNQLKAISQKILKHGQYANGYINFFVDP